MGPLNSNRFSVVGVSGSPSASSKSRRLLEDVLAAFGESGAATTLIDLAALPADALLGRRASSDVQLALASVASAEIVAVSTPVYRATYSGLLKVFCDLFAPGALGGKVAIPIATGGGPAHALCIDHGLRPLLASVGAVVVAAGIYGTDAEFTELVPNAKLLGRVRAAADEALALAEGLRAAPEVRSSSTMGS
ncbi:MAG TPA: NAD(P)H-dependent oxidoreductase [Gemmatimonadaceae bacterium]